MCLIYLKEKKTEVTIVVTYQQMKFPQIILLVVIHHAIFKVTIKGQEMYGSSGREMIDIIQEDDAQTAEQKMISLCGEREVQEVKPINGSNILCNVNHRDFILHQTLGDF